jgi:hypothetical protein
MIRSVVWVLGLLAAVVSGANAEMRQMLVNVTPRAAVAQAEQPGDGQIPYVLRVEGLRLAGNHASRLTIYGEAPSKGGPVLGTAEGVGWRGGPKLAEPHNFVIPLSQEAGRYLAGREQVKLWVRYEGMTELHFDKAVADISEPR